jgi:hypothetical protein
MVRNLPQLFSANDKKVNKFLKKNGGPVNHMFGKYLLILIVFLTTVSNAKMKLPDFLSEMSSQNTVCEDMSNQPNDFTKTAIVNDYLEAIKILMGKEIDSLEYIKILRGKSQIESIFTKNDLDSLPDSVKIAITKATEISKKEIKLRASYNESKIAILSAIYAIEVASDVTQKITRKIPDLGIITLFLDKGGDYLATQLAIKALKDSSTKLKNLNGFLLPAACDLKNGGGISLIGRGFLNAYVGSYSLDTINAKRKSLDPLGNLGKIELIDSALVCNEFYRNKLFFQKWFYSSCTDFGEWNNIYKEKIDEAKNIIASNRNQYKNPIAAGFSMYNNFLISYKNKIKDSIQKDSIRSVTIKEVSSEIKYITLNSEPNAHYVYLLKTLGLCRRELQEFEDERNMLVNKIQKIIDQKGNQLFHIPEYVKSNPFSEFWIEINPDTVFEECDVKEKKEKVSDLIPLIETIYTEVNAEKVYIYGYSSPEPLRDSSGCKLKYINNLNLSRKRAKYVVDLLKPRGILASGEGMNIDTSSVCQSNECKRRFEIRFVIRNSSPQLWICHEALNVGHNN